MYEAYFNLKKKPFDLLPNPDFLFPSKSHKRALTYLDYGIRERTGFILLTGEVGSGKTTIIRDLVKKFGDTVVLSKVFNTCVDSHQLLAMVNNDFGLSSEGKDKIAILRWESWQIAPPSGAFFRGCAAFGAGLTNWEVRGLDR